MTMTKLNSAPPAVIIKQVAFTFTVKDGLAGIATAPNIDGYTFVCWTGFRQSSGYGVWEGGMMANPTHVYNKTPASVNTLPSGGTGTMNCYALYTRNS